MGFYIQTPMNSGKAEFIIREYGAREVGTPPPDYSHVDEGEAVICVVFNTDMGFEAAGYAFDDDELERFKETPEDRRPRRWLLMDDSKARELTGYKQA